MTTRCPKRNSPCSRAQPRKAENRVFRFDVATGQVRELVTPEQVLGSEPEQLSAEERARRERMRVTDRGFTNFDVSEDGKLVLVSLSGRAFVVPSGGGPARQVAGTGPKGEAVFDPRLSPDGASVAFVRGGELWVASVDGGAARQLTQGATPLKTHAQAEFVAQEELHRFTGYWWAPDSKRLVYEEADEMFRVQVSRTRSKAYLLLTSGSHTASETFTAV